MAAWEDVRRAATALPQVTEDLPLARRVAGRLLAHERPLRPRDLVELGVAAPAGPVLGIRVGDLETKESLRAEQATAFTTSHFDGYPMVLSRLDELGAVDLPELVELAWLAKAPKRLATQWLTAR